MLLTAEVVLDELEEDDLDHDEPMMPEAKQKNFKSCFHSCSIT